MEAIAQGIRSVESKLTRHELREAQAADSTTKALNSMTENDSKTTNALAQMGQQLAAVEERVLAILTLVQTVSTRVGFSFSEFFCGKNWIIWNL